VSFVGFVATAVGRGRTVVVSSYRRPRRKSGRRPQPAEGGV